MHSYVFISLKRVSELTISPHLNFIHWLVYNIVALIITSIVVNGLLFLVPKYQTDPFAQQGNILQGVNLVGTAATSMVATVLIGARIYSSTRLNLQARRRYTHIIEITIQSSVLYSFAIVGQAITYFIGNGNFTLESSIINADLYMNAIAAITTVCFSIFAF